ncbi:hypothetical protein RCH19_000377 [Flavobacterium sp. PL12]
MDKKSEITIVRLLVIRISFFLFYNFLLIKYKEYA